MMKKRKPQGFDIKITHLSNSIQNTVSGDTFDTEISLLTASEQKRLQTAEWVFDWSEEMKDKSKQVYKLTIKGNPTIFQGLISLEDRSDHIFMHLIESAGFNKGKFKIYFGVPGNLAAFACRLSKEKGYDGVVSFFSRTRLIDYFKEIMGAKVLSGNQMIVDETAADKLIIKYFK